MDAAVTHDEIAELLGAYALDAVDPDEAAVVAAHVAVCPRCAAEVDEHRSTAALLAHQGADAPGALWDRIQQQLDVPASSPAVPEVDGTAGGGARRGPRVGAAPGDGPSVPGPGSSDRSFRSSPPPLVAVPGGAPRVVGPGGPGSSEPAARARWLRRSVPVLAAAAAVVIALLAVQVGRLDGRVGTLSAVAAHQGMPALAEAALADPQAERVALVAATSSRRTVGDLVILPNGSAFLVEGHMAPLPAGQTYQLWGINDGQAVSLGLLGRDPSVVAFDLGPAARVTSFAVTAEPAGGVVVATGPPVAVGTLHST
jgi:anti-sigma factor RsiW